MRGKFTGLVIPAIVVIAVGVFLCLATLSGDEKARKSKSVPLSERQSGELVDRIEHDLTVYGDEIAALIPQLAKKVDDKGSEYFVYMDETRGEVALKDLPREKLEALYVRVRNEATRLHQERITRQLESIQRATQTPRVPPTVYQAPTVTTPPKTPQIPQPPPSPPRVPETQRK